jgi:hypothetical protein
MRIHEPKVQTIDVRFYGAAVSHVQDMKTVNGVVEYRRVVAQILERRRCLMELVVIGTLSGEVRAESAIRIMATTAPRYNALARLRTEAIFPPDSRGSTAGRGSGPCPIRWGRMLNFA